jgi:pyruvate carboxylase
MARQLAQKAGIPTLPGSDEACATPADVLRVVESKNLGFPLMLKASFGGGGRGMREVHKPADLEASFVSCVRESSRAFGKDAVFVERLLKDPAHIEVQILGDLFGGVVHLGDRNCSIQRRHQKVVEIAPTPAMHQDLRTRILEDAVKLVSLTPGGFANAGTVEFLVEGSLLDANSPHYFIEVNPRLQVEHTVTEEVTGIDIVQTQILLSSGKSLSDLGLHQEGIQSTGVPLNYLSRLFNILLSMMGDMQGC